MSRWNKATEGGVLGLRWARCLASLCLPRPQCSHRQVGALCGGSECHWGLARCQAFPPSEDRVTVLRVPTWSRVKCHRLIYKQGLFCSEANTFIHSFIQEVLSACTCRAPFEAGDLVQWTKFISEILKSKKVEREKMPSNSVTVAVLFYLCLILILWILGSMHFCPEQGLSEGF